MSVVTLRPEANKKKIHYKNDFELCYFRHHYLRRTKTNPSKEEMAPYLKICWYLSKNTYITYRSIFRSIGFYLEDIESIAHVHLVSFLGLFALESVPEKYIDFIEYHQTNNKRTPSENDILNKNKANCTLFLKQRMEDLVRICRQKARNIRGQTIQDYAYFFGPNKPPAILRKLLEENGKYGFRKLNTAIYKTIKKKAKPENQELFKFNDNWYIRVPLEERPLELVDFSGADLDPRDNVHNMDPERIFFDNQNRDFWEEKRLEFNGLSPSERIRVIQTFITNNKHNSKFAEELKAARKLLALLEK